jgi:hypothetical protein
VGRRPVSDDIEAVIRELMMTYGPAAAVRLLREPAELPADAAIARKVKAAASNLAHAQRAGDWAGVRAVSDSLATLAEAIAACEKQKADRNG